MLHLHALIAAQATYPSKSDLRKALGLTSDSLRDLIENSGLEGLLDKVRNDDAFGTQHKLAHFITLSPLQIQITP